jgi:ABC-type multidrug transport system fused ATPase/permease subunit
MIKSYTSALFKASNYIENNIYNRFIPEFKLNNSYNWFTIFWDHKVILIFSFVLLTIEKFIEANTPFYINSMIQNNNFGMFFVLILLYIFSVIISFVGFQFLVRVERRITDSIQILCSQTQLNIDPVTHTTKSSGTIISKLQRGVSSISTILFNLFIELPTRFIYIGVSIYYMFKLSFSLGLIVTLITLGSIIFNAWYLNYAYLPIKKLSIVTEDKYMDNIIENITQAQLIRATFATPERSEMVIKNQKLKNIDEMARNHSYSLNYQITKTILTISILIIAYQIYNLTVKGEVEVGLAIAIITSYTIAAFQIINLGSNVSKLLSSVTDLSDFLSYQSKLGNQTYPVTKI